MVILRRENTLLFKFIPSLKRDGLARVFSLKTTHSIQLREIDNQNLLNLCKEHFPSLLNGSESPTPENDLTDFLIDADGIDVSQLGY